MGYDTTFQGQFYLDKPLQKEHRDYLIALADTRRMKRDPEKAAALPDPCREAAGLPIGDESEYFVGGTGHKGQGDDDSVIDHNACPGEQPSLWLQWVPFDKNGWPIEDPASDTEAVGIGWDGSEKFYDSQPWIKYLIERFLAPWGYKLNGEVVWQGESEDDWGIIIVKENAVEIKDDDETIESLIDKHGDLWGRYDDGEDCED